MQNPDPGINIKNGVFAKYTGQAECVEVPEGIVGIGKAAFASCQSVRRVILHDGLKRIGRSAFESSGLEKITIPHTVTVIVDKAFYKCRSLKNFKCRGKTQHLRLIGSEAFSESGLKSFEISAFVDRLGDCVFACCQGLEKVVLPNGISCVPRYTFYESSVEKVVVPDSVTEICDSAFSHSLLSSIDLPAGLKKIGVSAFKTCQRMKAIALPDSVTDIDSTAFQGCPFKNITLPTSLRTLGFGAFYLCDFKEVMIPDQVTSIDSWAFNRNVKLYGIRYGKMGDEPLIVMDAEGGEESNDYHTCDEPLMGR